MARINRGCRFCTESIAEFLGRGEPVRMEERLQELLTAEAAKNGR
jgi:hypothetical protein